MKFFIGKPAFAKLLALQNGIVEKRGPARILSHILIRAENIDGKGILTLTGTDLDISLIAQNPVSVEEEGEVTVCAHTLHDIVRKLSDNIPVSVETQKDGAFIKLMCATSEFLLPTLPVSEFPKIHPQELSEHITIPAKDFRYLVSKTKFAMSTEEARHILNGIFFNHEDGKWNAVATDAHRLAVCWIDFQTDTPIRNALVGRKAINELAKLLDGVDGDINISIHPHQILVSFDNIFFASRLLEGTFPEYNNVIPKEHSFDVEVDVKEFSKCIELIAMVSSDKNRVVKLTFHNEKITFSAHSEQYGSGVEELSGIAYKIPEVFTINFNPRYMLDICGNISGDRIIIRLKDPVSPAIITDPTTGNELYVIMPMRV